ncbi:hypothetical protein HK096_003817 [Nowakowskiella sp. JEL0078]|nr:hypothetical protein HK096_003817 [Nowakowskiella sp. JEL0078]
MELFIFFWLGREISDLRLGSGSAKIFVLRAEFPKVLFGEPDRNTAGSRELPGEAAGVANAACLALDSQKSTDVILLRMLDLPQKTPPATGNSKRASSAVKVLSRGETKHEQIIKANPKGKKDDAGNKTQAQPQTQSRSREDVSPILWAHLSASFIDELHSNSFDGDPESDLK